MNLCNLFIINSGIVETPFQYIMNHFCRYIIATKWNSVLPAVPHRILFCPHRKIFIQHWKRERKEKKKKEKSKREHFNIISPISGIFHIYLVFYQEDHSHIFKSHNSIQIYLLILEINIITLLLLHQPSS